jgi:toxin CcdB
MAQFDVHRNPGRSRGAIPYLLVLQSAYFDDTPNRLVAPLLLGGAARDLRPPAHLPRFTVEDREVIMDALQLQPVPRTLLGPAIATLADDDSAIRIITAVDEVISRGYG